LMLVILKSPSTQTILFWGSFLWMTKAH
jgi:hypothetical protein